MTDMDISNSNASPRYRWPDIAILAIACGLVFILLGERLLWGSEGRWAEVTREMILTGDYFHPTINGEPYFDKPLISYWFIAGIALLTGTLNELVVRLPSAVAGLAAVWATLRLGSRLWSPAAGRIAASIMMTCYGVLLWSRSGAADTENLATVILCTLWYWSRRDKLNFSTFLVLYLIVFVGSHAKGPVAAVVTALVILPDAMTEGRWKSFLRPSALLALAIGLAVFLAPFIWASRTNPLTYQTNGLALVWQENFLRFLSPTDHRNPIYTYLLAVPELIMPWAPLFICALILAVKEWKNLDTKARWLLKAIVLIFIFFTICRSRRGYYILPIIPFCALLTGVVWCHLKKSGSAAIARSGFDIQKYLLYGAVLVELAAGAVFLIIPMKKAGVGLASICLASITVALAAIFAGLLSLRWVRHLAVEPEEKAFLPVAVIAVVLMGGFFCVQQPVMEEYRSEREFVARLKVVAADIPAERIALLQKGEVDAKMVFYVGKESPVTLLRYNSKEQDAVKLAADAQTISTFLRSPLPGTLIAQTRYVSDLPAECRSLFAQTPDLNEQPMPFQSKSSQGESWQAWLLNAEKTTTTSRQTGDEATDAK